MDQWKDNFAKEQDTRREARCSGGRAPGPKGALQGMPQRLWRAWPRVWPWAGTRCGVLMWPMLGRTTALCGFLRTMERECTPKLSVLILFQTAHLPYHV